MTTNTKIHPMEAVDYDMIDFWLRKMPRYRRSEEYHNPIHRELIRPRYGPSGPLPVLLVLSGGEQSGKTWLGSAHMFALHWAAKILWIVGARYEDCRYEFERVVEAALESRVIDPVNISHPAQGPSRATFNNGCVLRTLSSEDESKLSSESPDGVLMVEAGQQTYQAFRTLWTRVTHNTGWLIVSGTFEQYKGRWFPDLWNMCQGGNEFHGRSIALPTYANPEKYPEGPNDPKILAIQKTLSEDEFAERFLGIPRAPLGVVFPEFRRSLHVRSDVVYHPMYPIRLWIDPGYYPASYAVLFVQIINGQIRILKEYYTNSAIPEYIALSRESRLEPLTHEPMAELISEDPLFSSVEKIVMDVAGTYHMGASETALDTWRRVLARYGSTDAGAIPIVGRYVTVEDGLKRTHDKLRMNPLLNAPNLVLNPAAENTIWELEQGYRYNLKGSRDFGDIHKPINKHNHSAKAIAYGIVDAFGLAEGKAPGLPLPTRKKMSYDRYARSVSL